MAKFMVSAMVLIVILVQLEPVTCTKGGREVLDFINQNRGQKDLPKGIQRKLDAWDYMKMFGYLTSDPEDMTWGEFQRNLKAAQKMMNIDQSGVVDEATAGMMAKDRCGNPDFVKGKNPTKRFTIFGEKYKKQTRHVTWTVSQYSYRKTEQEVNWAVSEAYAGWAKNTNLIFSATNCSSPDTYIKFINFTSGTGNLGNADWPQNHGIRMNDLFDFQIPPSTKAYQMLPVVLHEIGHQLGLLHSEFSNSVMRPWYTGITEPQWDDIAGIQSIYGGPDDVYATDEAQPDSCVPEWFLSPIPEPGTDETIDVELVRV